ncbi:MAG: M1 family metallopeptidase, partial [Rhodothermales bacterium]|nr:M1 family metallopeptidase [Rhodothermales bacterium]
LVLGFALVLPTLVHAQASTNSETPLSDRRVSYRIDATLDPELRTVTGSQRLTWRNDGPAPVDELQFHLYLNAFSPGSTFQVESGGVHRGNSDSRDDRWGGVEIERLAVAGELPSDLDTTLPYSGAPLDLTARMRFIQPDDGNTNDRTVMAVSLPEAVQPGETIALDMEFESKLPRVVARTGFAEDPQGRPFFMVAQWFPKIAVYELPGQRYVPADAATGQWNAHQFHANSEFYADFGTYDVSIRVPESFVVGASGVRTDEAVEDGLKTLRYRADDVHDFAWTAYEDYRVHEETWRHVQLRLLLRPEHDTETQVRRHMDSVIAALERFDAWVGEYPYTTLTIVDAPGGARGMEYPTLITGLTLYMGPSWMRVPEMVAIHEFGHQYFYGLLASNEFEEAWLDEGMNSYVESKVMDDTYGEGAMMEIPGLPLSSRAMQRLSYVKQNPARGSLATWSWEYDFSADYGKNSYAKPATVMNTLEGYLGWETMKEFLRTYYREWRFRHPSTQDLQEVAERVADEDLDWFFDQYVYGTAVLDYRIEQVTASRDSSIPDSLDARYINRVVVQRVYDGHMPTTVRMTFRDGTTHDIPWDGREAWKEFRVERDSPLAAATLDPEGVLWLDIDRLNNRRVVGAGDSPATAERRKFSVRFHQLALLISALF